MQDTDNQDYNKGIIAWFVNNPVAANLLMFAVVMLGLTTFGTLRREDFPVTEPSTLTISVSYESGSASLAETGIATKIEEAIEAVQGIREITSISTPSGCTITVEKADDYDMDTLLRDIKNKVDTIPDLPLDAERPIVEASPEKQLAVYAQLYGDTSLFTLQELAEELRLDLLAMSEINDAELIGGAEQNFTVTVNEGILQSYGLTLADIAGKINNYSFLSASATLRSEERNLRVQTASQGTSLEDFNAIPLIEDSSGVRLRLADVATVIQSFEDTPSVLVRFNGQSAMTVAIYMVMDASVTKVVEQVHEVVSEWQNSGRIPQNVQLTTWDDASRYITERLSLLQNNILQGILLVFIVLLLFINIRIAFWVALSMPFIFLGTFIFMGETFFGLSLNEVTTFGFIMALGIIVDDAVVVGESVESLRLRESVHMNSRKIAILGTKLVATPTTFGVLTTVATFFPLYFTAGEMGQVFGQFAIVVSIALLLSMVQSKLVLPSHLAKLPPYSEKENKGVFAIFGNIQRNTNRILEAFAQKIYRPILHIAFQNAYATLIILLAIFILSTGLLSSGKVRFAFFPTIANNLITAQITMAVDSGYGLTRQHALMLEETALEADDFLRNGNESIIENIFINSSNDEEIIALIEIKPIEHIRSLSYSAQDLVEKWKELLGNPEGNIYVNVSSTVETAESFTPELSHSDKEILQEAGAIVLQELQSLEGVINVEHNLEDTTEQWQIEVNNSGYALGLTNEMVYNQVYAIFDGITAQTFTLNYDEIDVEVRSLFETEGNTGQLQQALIRTPTGQIVPLTSVADIVAGQSEEKITRIDAKRVVYFSVLLDKSILSATEVQEHLTLLTDELKRQYPGLNVNFGGETEEMNEIVNSLITLVTISMLAVYTLLAIPLKSYFQPLLIMSVIPFGFVGAVTGHWLTSFEFSMMSLFGILALAGVIINNSLLLVTAYNDNCAQGKRILQAIEQACISRLRPILLTSATTFMGLLPLLSNTSEQAQMLIPAATSLAYGILFGTIITLILIPVLLKITDDISVLLNNAKSVILKLHTEH